MTFTKKDLFWSVKGQYPNAQIGKSMLDYKEAVAKVLGGKFELSDEIMANNLQLKKFILMFCTTISRLMNKFSKNYIVMVASKDHTVFFSKEITVEMLTEAPRPPGPKAIDQDTQTRKNDFAGGLEVLTVSHKTQTPKAWIPQSWKPSLANRDAVDNDDTSDAFDAFVAGAAGDANDTEPPNKIRKVGPRQTQRDAKDLRAEVKSSEVC